MAASGAKIDFSPHLSSVQAESASKFLVSNDSSYVHWQTTDEDGAALTDLW